MSNDLVTWFEEANGFAQGTKAPHKWVLQAEQELRFQKRRIEELEANLAKALEGFEKLACLGNGDRYGNSDGNVIAQGYIAKLTGGKDE